MGREIWFAGGDAGEDAGRGQSIEAGRGSTAARQGPSPPCRIAHGQQRRILSFQRGAILRPAGSKMRTKGEAEGGLGGRRNEAVGLVSPNSLLSVARHRYFVRFLKRE